MTPAYCNRSTVSTQHGDHRDRQRQHGQGQHGQAQPSTLPGETSRRRGRQSGSHAIGAITAPGPPARGVVAPTAEGHPPAGRYSGGTRNGALESATGTIPSDGILGRQRRAP